MTRLKRAMLVGFLLLTLLTIATMVAILVREKRQQLSQHSTAQYKKIELYVCEKAVPYIYGDKSLEDTKTRFTINVISTIETSGSLTRALCVGPED